MAELELTRARDDRRLYVLDGVGTLRLHGWGGRAATATADRDGRAWELVRRGLFKVSVEATDALGTLVGSYEPRTFGRGGALLWGGRALTMRPASAWVDRYALADGDLELAVYSPRGWSKRPVSVRVGDPAADPGLLLYAAYVARVLADDANAAATGGSSGMMTTG